MLVKLRCKSCFAKVAADDDVLGKEVNCPNCNARFFIPVPQFGFGKALGGYEIEQFLGSGAMGEVYMARQISMNRPVALKVIKHDISMDAEVVKRFTLEAQTLARLNHPNIVPAFDAGHTDECYYMAMGYIDGETLEDKLKRSGSMDEIELLKISSKVIDALEYAWDEFKLLHRDIKPANIMIDQMGEVRIMDMGIAKNTTEDGGLTQPGLVVGTPFFMSPEQAQASEGIDYKSDVYALAATMYQMITGVLPFQGPNVMAILAKKVNSPLVPPHEIKPYVTRETSELILKLLNYVPKNRFTDFSDLRDSMDSCLEASEKNIQKSENVVKTKYMKVPDEVLKAAKTEVMAKSQNVRAMKKKKSKNKLMLIGLLSVIVALTLVLLLMPNSKESVSEVKLDKETKVNTKISKIDQSGLSDMFTEETAVDFKDEFANISTKEFLKRLQKVSIRNRGPHNANKLESKGEVSRGPGGALFLRGGMYFNNEVDTDIQNSFQDKYGFSCYVTFKLDAEHKQDGIIFSYGRDDKDFNFKLECRGDQVYLVTRQFFGHKPKIREQKILSMNTNVSSFLVTYRPGKLLVYLGAKKVFESDSYNGLMQDWLAAPFSFGGNVDGKPQYWRGMINNFFLFSAFVQEERVVELVSLINRKPEKPGKMNRR